jgi:hypothetical protein
MSVPVLSVITHVYNAQAGVELCTLLFAARRVPCETAIHVLSYPLRKSPARGLNEHAYKKD